MNHSNKEAEPDDPRRLVVLTVDRLGAGYLGPYGNTWIETPGANHLASQSLLLENFFVESMDPHQFVRSVLTGRHVLDETIESSAETDDGLLELIRQRSGESILITDDPELAENNIGGWFDEVLCQDSDQDRDDEQGESAESLEETRLARLFGGAIDWIEQNPDTTLLWIHVSSLDCVWDAPLEMRAQFADEEDPDPSRLVSPPALIVKPDHDPDELTSIGFAYAGQIVAFDWCLAVLMQAIESIPESQRPLLLLAGTRGFPLGEHGVIGNAGECLHEELVHVPLMLALPDRQHALIRSFEICQPADLHAVLSDWLSGGSVNADLQAVTKLARSNDNHHCAVIRTASQVAIRTPRWYLIQISDDEQAGSGGSIHLFVKPDDRWEANEISSRCQQLVTDLSEFLATCLTAIRTGRPLNSQRWEE